MIERLLYHYKAIVTDCHDGDTVTADIDLGLGVWMKGQKLRLFGLNAPELRGPETELALRALEFLTHAVMDKTVILETIKDKKGKYGRWLVNIMVPPNTQTINEQLLAQGLAQEATY